MPCKILATTWISKISKNTKRSHHVVGNIRKWQNEQKIWLIPDNQNSKNILLENLFKTGDFNFEPEEDSPAVKTPSQNEKNPLEIEKLTDRLKARHYSPRTVENYTKWINQFLSIYKHSDSTTSQKNINEFLTNLAVKDNVSPSTQNQALVALLFYFRHVKHVEPDNLCDVIHAKHKKEFRLCLQKKKFDVL